MNYNNNTQFSIFAYVLIVVLIVDVMLSMSFDFLEKQLSSIWGFILFISIASIFFIIPPYILKFKDIDNTGQSIGTIKNKTFFKIIHKAVSVIHYITATTILILVFQMILTTSYSISIVIVNTIISYILAAILLAVFCYKLCKWYAYNKRSLVILLYALAMGLAAISTTVNIISFNLIMLENNEENVKPKIEVEFPNINPISYGFVGILYNIGFLSLIPAYTSAWLGSALLLHKYSQRFGRKKYWIIISLPLAFYLGAILPTLIAFSSDAHFNFYMEDMILFRIIFKISVITGAIMFGISFLAVSSKITKNINNRLQNEKRQIIRKTTIGDYFIIAAFGITMLAIVIETPVYHATYPLFGIINSSSMVLASYIFSFGFYASALSLSQDIQLRQIIRSLFKEDESDTKLLLDSIGTAEMEQELQKRLFKIAKEKSDLMEQESGVESLITNDEIKDYLRMLIEEKDRK